MIVEDEGLIANHTASVLKKAGHVVAGIAASADELFELMPGSDSDLVLMDIRIDGPLDGIQTAAKLREESDVPVIFLSAHSDKQTLERAKGVGASSFLTKPVNRAVLLNAVKEGIQKRKVG